MYCQSFEIITKLLKVLVSECLAKTETRSVLDFRFFKSNFYYHINSTTTVFFTKAQTVNLIKQQKL